MRLKVIIHPAEEGGFWAEAPALPGCVSQGDTRAEVEMNIREAIVGWLSAGDEETATAPHDEVIELAV
jgi:predicted RNase H-like HicB family nuclease